MEEDRICQLSQYKLIDQLGYISNYEKGMFVKDYEKSTQSLVILMCRI